MSKINNLIFYCSMLFLCMVSFQNCGEGFDSTSNSFPSQSTNVDNQSKEKLPEEVTPAPAPTTDNSVTNPKIFFIGDSWIAQDPISDGVTEALDATFIGKSGYGGGTTGEVINWEFSDRSESQVAWGPKLMAADADIVFITTGVNDYYRERSTELFTGYLLSLYNKIKKYGPEKVIYLIPAEVEENPNQLYPWSSYVEAIKDLGIPYIDLGEGIPPYTPGSENWLNGTHIDIPGGIIAGNLVKESIDDL